MASSSSSSLSSRAEPLILRHIEELPAAGGSHRVRGGEGGVAAAGGGGALSSSSSSGSGGGGNYHHLLKRVNHSLICYKGEVYLFGGRSIEPNALSNAISGAAASIARRQAKMLRKQRAAAAAALGVVGGGGAGNASALKNGGGGGGSDPLSTNVDSLMNKAFEDVFAAEFDDFDSATNSGGANHSNGSNSTAEIAAAMAGEYVPGVWRYDLKTRQWRDCQIKVTRSMLSPQHPLHTVLIRSSEPHASTYLALPPEPVSSSSSSSAAVGGNGRVNSAASTMMMSSVDVASSCFTMPLDQETNRLQHGDNTPTIATAVNSPTHGVVPSPPPPPPPPKFVGNTASASFLRVPTIADFVATHVSAVAASGGAGGGGRAAVGGGGGSSRGVSSSSASSAPTTGPIANAFAQTFSPPSLRGDHLAVVIGHHMLVHGGRRYKQIYDDMYAFDLRSHVWCKVNCESHRGPGPVFGHAGVVVFDNSRTVMRAVEEAEKAALLVASHNDKHKKGKQLEGNIGANTSGGGEKDDVSPFQPMPLLPVYTALPRQNAFLFVMGGVHTQSYHDTSNSNAMAKESEEEEGTDRGRMLFVFDCANCRWDSFAGPPNVDANAMHVVEMAYVPMNTVAEFCPPSSSSAKDPLTKDSNGHSPPSTSSPSCHFNGTMTLGGGSSMGSRTTSRLLPFASPSQSPFGGSRPMSPQPPMADTNQREETLATRVKSFFEKAPLPPRFGFGKIYVLGLDEADPRRRGAASVYGGWGQRPFGGGRAGGTDTADDNGNNASAAGGHGQFGAPSPTRNKGNAPSMPTPFLSPQNGSIELYPSAAAALSLFNHSSSPQRGAQQQQQQQQQQRKHQQHLHVLDLSTMVWQKILTHASPSSPIPFRIAEMRACFRYTGLLAAGGLHIKKGGGGAGDQWVFILDAPPPLPLASSSGQGVDIEAAYGASDPFNAVSGSGDVNNNTNSRQQQNGGDTHRFSTTAVRTEEDRLGTSFSGALPSTPQASPSPLSWQCPSAFSIHNYTTQKNKQHILFGSNPTASIGGGGGGGGGGSDAFSSGGHGGAAHSSSSASSNPYGIRSATNTSPLASLPPCLVFSFCFTGHEWSMNTLHDPIQQLVVESAVAMAGKQLQHLNPSMATTATTSSGGRPQSPLPPPSRVRSMSPSASSPTSKPPPATVTPSKTTSNVTGDSTALSPPLKTTAENTAPVASPTVQKKEAKEGGGMVGVNSTSSGPPHSPQATTSALSSTSPRLPRPPAPPPASALLATATTTTTTTNTTTTTTGRGLSPSGRGKQVTIVVDRPEEEKEKEKEKESTEELVRRITIDRMLGCGGGRQHSGGSAQISNPFVFSSMTEAILMTNGGKNMPSTLLLQSPTGNSTNSIHTPHNNATHSRHHQPSDPLAHLISSLSGNVTLLPPAASLAVTALPTKASSSPSSSSLAVPPPPSSLAFQPSLPGMDALRMAMRVSDEEAWAKGPVGGVGGGGFGGMTGRNAFSGGGVGAFGAGGRGGGGGGGGGSLMRAAATILQLRLRYQSQVLFSLNTSSTARRALNAAAAGSAADGNYSNAAAYSPAAASFSAVAKAAATEASDHIIDAYYVGKSFSLGLFSKFERKYRMCVVPMFVPSPAAAAAAAALSVPNSRNYRSPTSSRSPSPRQRSRSTSPLTRSLSPSKPAENIGRGEDNEGAEDGEDERASDTPKKSRSVRFAKTNKMNFAASPPSASVPRPFANRDHQKNKLQHHQQQHYAPSPYLVLQSAHAKLSAQARRLMDEHEAIDALMARETQGGVMFIPLDTHRQNAYRIALKGRQRRRRRLGETAASAEEEDRKQTRDGRSETFSSDNTAITDEEEDLEDATTDVAVSGKKAKKGGPRTHHKASGDDDDPDDAMSGAGSMSDTAGEEDAASTSFSPNSTLLSTTMTTTSTALAINHGAADATRMNLRAAKDILSTEAAARRRSHIQFLKREVKRLKYYVSISESIRSRKIAALIANGAATSHFVVSQGLPSSLLTLGYGIVAIGGCEPFRDRVFAQLESPIDVALNRVLPSLPSSTMITAMINQLTSLPPSSLAVAALPSATAESPSSSAVIGTFSPNANTNNALLNPPAVLTSRQHQNLLLDESYFALAAANRARASALRVAEALLNRDYINRNGVGSSSNTNLNTTTTRGDDPLLLSGTTASSSRRKRAAAGSPQRGGKESVGGGKGGRGEALSPSSSPPSKTLGPAKAEQSKHSNVVGQGGTNTRLNSPLPALVQTIRSDDEQNGELTRLVKGEILEDDNESATASSTSRSPSPSSSATQQSDSKGDGSSSDASERKRKRRRRRRDSDAIRQMDASTIAKTMLQHIKGEGGGGGGLSSTTTTTAGGGVVVAVGKDSAALLKATDNDDDDIIDAHILRVIRAGRPMEVEAAAISVAAQKSLLLEHEERRGGGYRHRGQYETSSSPSPSAVPPPLTNTGGAKKDVGECNVSRRGLGSMLRRVSNAIESATNRNLASNNGGGVGSVPSSPQSPPRHVGGNNDNDGRSLPPSASPTAAQQDSQARRHFPSSPSSSPRVGGGGGGNFSSPSLPLVPGRREQHQQQPSLSRPNTTPRHRPFVPFVVPHFTNSGSANGANNNNGTSFSASSVVGVVSVNGGGFNKTGTAAREITNPQQALTWSLEAYKHERRRIVAEASETARRVHQQKEDTRKAEQSARVQSCVEAKKRGGSVGGRSASFAPSPRALSSAGGVGVGVGSVGSIRPLRTNDEQRKHQREVDASLSTNLGNPFCL